MQINPVNLVQLNSPAPPGVTSADVGTVDRQVVWAVQSLNQSEMLGQDRELSYRRDPKSGRLVIQILQKGTGEVIDQIPPEVFLRLRESLDPRVKEETSEP